MLPLLVALPFSLFVWVCCVVILAMAISVGLRCAWTVAMSFRKGWGEVMVSALFGGLLAGFCYIVAVGALELGGSVINGMIERLS